MTTEESSVVAEGSADERPPLEDLLAGVGFPVSKEELLDRLRVEGAPEDLLEPIRRSLATRFGSRQEVLDAMHAG